MDRRDGCALSTFVSVLCGGVTLGDGFTAWIEVDITF